MRTPQASTGSQRHLCTSGVELLKRCLCRLRRRDALCLRVLRGQLRQQLLIGFQRLLCLSYNLQNLADFSRTGWNVRSEQHEANGTKRVRVGFGVRIRDAFNAEKCALRVKWSPCFLPAPFLRPRLPQAPQPGGARLGRRTRCLAATASRCASACSRPAVAPFHLAGPVHQHWVKWGILSQESKGQVIQGSGSAHDGVDKARRLQHLLCSPLPQKHAAKSIERPCKIAGRSFATKRVMPALSGGVEGPRGSQRRRT